MFGLGEMVASGINFLGGLRQQDQNARMAADQAQRDERGAQVQMQYQSEQASTARAWMERLSGSAHQREVSDLRAAGLNPILSGTGGMGSATPASPSPAGSKAGASIQAPAPNLGESINTGWEASMRRKNINADTDKKEAERSYLRLQGNLSTVDYQKREEELQTQKALTRQAEAQASILSSNAKGAGLEGGIDETRYGEVMRYINRAIRAITGGSSAYRNLDR